MSSASAPSPFKMILFSLLFIGGVIYPYYSCGPGLLADARATSNWAPAQELMVKSAKCTRFLLLVSLCTVEYRDLLAPQTKQPNLEYFIYGSWGGESTTILRNVDDPSRISTSVAIRDLRARLIMMGVWALFTVAILSKLMKGAKPSSRDGGGHALEPSRQNEASTAPPPKAAAPMAPTQSPPVFGRRQAR